jgi:hypothetical protein
VSYLYVGDIGDNGKSRAQVQVYRVPEPAVYLDQHLAPVERDLKGVTQITITYPDGAHDAETLLIDPVTGDLFIATKQSGSTAIYRAAADDLAGGGPVVLSFERSFGIGFLQQATAGDISPTGREIIIKGYGFARMWLRGHGQTVGAALGGAAINIPFVGFPTKPQGETIAFDRFGASYFTVSEGTSQPLYKHTRTSNDGPRPTTALVAAGATWKYLDDGSDQGTAWRDADFDDGSWADGDAQLGYGDGDERTVVSFGGDPNDRHVTTYFRARFEVEDPDLAAVTLRTLFDDGAAVYVNGAEVERSGLAADAAFDELALDERSDLEDTWQAAPIDAALLVSGTNVVAAEVHQVSPSSDDLSFDLQIDAADFVPIDDIAFEVIFGEHVGGTVEDLLASDDAYVTVQQLPAASVFLPLIRLELEAVAATSATIGMTVVIETATTAQPGRPLQKVLLHDFDLGVWELIDERLATLGDAVARVNIDGDARRFIEPGANTLRMRLDWFDPGDVFSPAWGTRTDQAVWRIAP